MEIRIQTQDEARSGRVTIEIKPDGRDEIGPDDYWKAEAIDLRGQLEQATRRALELDGALAESQVEETRLAGELAVLTDRRDEAFAEARTLDNAIIQKDARIASLERQVNDATAAIAKSSDRINELDRRCLTEKSRADLNYDAARDDRRKLSEIRGLIESARTAPALAAHEFADVITKIHEIFDREDTERAQS